MGGSAGGPHAPGLEAVDGGHEVRLRLAALEHLLEKRLHVHRLRGWGVYVMLTCGCDQWIDDDRSIESFVQPASQPARGPRHACTRLAAGMQACRHVYTQRTSSPRGRVEATACAIVTFCCARVCGVYTYVCGREGGLSGLSWVWYAVPCADRGLGRGVNQID